MIVPLFAGWALLTAVAAEPQLSSLGYVGGDAPEAAAASGDGPRAPAAATHPLDRASVPPELAPWLPWVAARHPDLGCARVDEEYVCAWLGALSLDLTDTGGSGALSLHLDAPSRVRLPGSPGAWPQGVRDGAGPVAVLREEDQPVAWLPAGDHRLTWTFAWPSRPTNLALPPGVGVVSLTVDGAPVPFPLLDASGGLRTGATAADGPGENRLEIEVHRRIEDDVPVRVTTRVMLRASGAPREVGLGAVTLAGTLPYAVEADLPIRLMPDGTLTAQLRPGTFYVTIEAVAGQPVTTLTPPALPAPWPEQEVWAVKTDDRIRMVDLSGPPGVDPARTTLPDAWRGLPTFIVTPTTPLAFAELRRGEPEPAPSAVGLQRELWLDFDGGGLTVRDRLTGTLNQAWRLDTLGPAALGHAADHGQDLVITTRDGATGIELRDVDLDVLAEARVEGRPSTMPAVGWNQDVQSLAATLHLPPGWSLLWASGVDALDGPDDPWTLFDLFFVLVLSLALYRLFDWRWGLIALAALTIARHVDGAPAFTWIVLTVLIAVERVVPEGHAQTALRWTRRGSLLWLFGLLLPLAYTSLREGLFPQIRPGLTSMGDVYDVFDPSFDAQAERVSNEPSPKMAAPPPPPPPGGRGGGEEGASSGYDMLSRKAPAAAQKSVRQQVDPKAVVQTGPGVPTWQWNRWSLSWSGPVDRSQQIRLWLVGPLGNLAIAVVRTALLLLLGLRMAGVDALRRAGPGTRGLGLALIAALAVGAPSTARAMPDADALDELEARLIVRPACGDACATASSLSLSVAGDVLTLDVEVSAADLTSWPLPGPASTWTPARVELDGTPTLALSRREDGAIHVRIPPGVHRVRATGPLPPTDAIALDLPAPPELVRFTGDGWTIEGVKADQTVSGAVRLVRATPAVAGAMSENLPEWLEVHRTLEIGLPWTVRTEVRRIGAPTQPVSVRVPLLPGESLTDEAFEAVDGVVQVALQRDEPSVAWTSALADTSPLVLTAPTGVPWTEVWTLVCSPIFACAAEGPAPIQHVDGPRWEPTWRVWPGESLTLAITRPEGVAGQTITVDAVNYVWRPGLRLGEGSVELQVRSSQGGRLPVTLPPGADLRAVQIDGSARPIQLDGDGVVAAPLHPGTNRIAITWQQPHALSAIDHAPVVRLGAPAVNVSVVVQASPDRWILALRGPAWGPVPLFWGYLLLVLIAAPLLARLPYAPLNTASWVLLGLGMTQVPIAVPMVVALVFLAFGWRKANPIDAWWLFNLTQLALVGALFVGLVCLYAAIHTGLLVQPDMQIAGGGSYGLQLTWRLDRTAGDLPTPTIISLPLWTFRVAMLLWALWLAARMVAWAPWVWSCWTAGGMWRGLPPRSAPEPSSDAGG